MYIWNHFLINEFQNKVKCDSWFVEFVYGSFEQQPCLLFGEEIRLTVIARRSRHFAGTRYLKRGISDDGKVANDVEVEQIIERVGDGRITSHVQNRGSIPVFWTQKTSATDPKPDIILAQSKEIDALKNKIGLNPPNDMYRVKYKGIRREMQHGIGDLKILK